MENEQELIGAYIPALHRGYTDFFDRYPTAEISVFDTDILSGFDYLRKDIRALSPDIAVHAISGLGRSARLLSSRALTDAFNTEGLHLIMADDDVSRSLALTHNKHIAQVSFESVFLRWDRENVMVNQEVVPDREVAMSTISERILHELGAQREASTNWWRHVSAVITDGHSILTAAHNQTLPTDYTSYIESDPRITAHRGSKIETSLDIHAESQSIADAARQGIPLEGAEIYVSTFPCPTCAKLIASSGIHTCYFVEGYAMLDGYSVLKAADIEIVKINTELPEQVRSIAIPYKQKTS